MEEFTALKRTVASLREPGGCPWDQEQTHQSLTICLVEECSELLEAIDILDMELMREDLGDLLLQVVMHARFAEEEGHFDLADVVKDIDDKLVRRHPHVFGDASKLGTGEEVIVEWEKIKAAEKKDRPPEGVFKDLPPKLPALLHALETYKRIQKKNLPAEDALDVECVKTMAEGLDEAGAGEMFFNLVAACREAGVDPEAAVRRHAGKVQSRIEEKVKSQA
jgi:MazG family protein